MKKHEKYMPEWEKAVDWHNKDESGDGITWQGLQSSPCKNDSTDNYKFSWNFWKMEKLIREMCLKRTNWKL